jgi:hypothetical protein
MHKTLTAIAVAAAMTLAAVAVPQQAEARNGRIVGAVIGGLAAGAIIGSLAAQGDYYYGPGYYYAPGYYGPGYTYGPGYYYGPGPYAYEPPPLYVRPVPRYYRGGSCWITTDSDRGFGYWGACR